jgi:hypothetical protein
MNAARKKGTRIALAALIPATITTKDAIVSNTLDGSLLERDAGIK